MYSIFLASITVSLPKEILFYMSHTRIISKCLHSISSLSANRSFIWLMTTEEISMFVTLTNPSSYKSAPSPVSYIHWVERNEKFTNDLSYENSRSLEWEFQNRPVLTLPDMGPKKASRWNSLDTNHKDLLRLNIVHPTFGIIMFEFEKIKLTTKDKRCSLTQ